MKLSIIVLFYLCGCLLPVQSLDNDTVITIESRFFFKELLQMWSVYFFRSKPVTRINQSDNDTEPNGSNISKASRNSSETESSNEDQTEMLSCRLSPVNYWNYRSGSVKIPVVLQIDRVPLDKDTGLTSSPPKSDASSPVSSGKANVTSKMIPTTSGNGDKSHKTRSRESSRKCTFILIYAKWCRFSMTTAGAFNALGRAFPQLEFLALAVNDFQEFRWNLHTSYVPRVKLYWGNKAVREFHGGGGGGSADELLEELVEFVFQTTGQLPVVKPERSAEDLVGPVSTQIEPPSQFWLGVSWVLTVLCSLYLAGSTTSGRLLLGRLCRWLKPA